MYFFCHTEFHIYGSKEDLTLLRSKLAEWVEFKNICDNAGVECVDSMDTRGSITRVSNIFDDRYIILCTDSAWNARLSFWQSVFDKLGVTVRITYLAIEPVTKYYAVYDPHGIGDFDKYQYRIVDGDDELDLTETMLREYLQKKLATSEDDIEELCQAASKLIQIYKYDRVK